MMLHSHFTQKRSGTGAVRGFTKQHYNGKEEVWGSTFLVKGLGSCYKTEHTSALKEEREMMNKYRKVIPYESHKLFCELLKSPYFRAVVELNGIRGSHEKGFSCDQFVK